MSWVPGTPAAGWVVGPSAVTEWPTADVTWWTPPDPLAVSAEGCADIVAVTDGLDPVGQVGHEVWDSMIWRCDTWQLDQARAEHVAGYVARVLHVANLCWWRLDVVGWRFEVKRYGPGTEHPRHQDLHVGQLERKLALSVQLSDGGDYDGGDLFIHPTVGPGPVAAPRDRGTPVVFPGWVSHEVTPITAGVRWALIGWAVGSPVR